MLVWSFKGISARLDYVSLMALISWEKADFTRFLQEFTAQIQNSGKNETVLYTRVG
jgi:hypothetical protein